ncbi:hypothetical protein [Rhodohalobacter mucosus]|uniref:Tetracyclin repressor-like C-terminal domain-containing protein n=1 Tax=Rhodohalobacter mucosus TaxID=2079485 RepID=A0A316TL04_9BACT|nr:hypothetical protein [Rhodohalobacter mucosus]PWN05237.1 hypothetical protein DDZ15_14235 [Rhodohalobacter mucosus]
MDKETEKRITIAEAATKRFVENPRFTIRSLAKELDMESADIFDLFPNRSSILRYYYSSRMLRFRDETGSLDDYSSYTLGEKLSALHLSLADQFQEQREFVLQTFKRSKYSYFRTSAFAKEYRQELQNIFENDHRIPATAAPFINRFLYQSLYYQFTGLISFWKRDESRNYENTMALIDKWSALTEEIFYSQIAEKGFDLAKFLYYQSPLSECMTSSSTNNKREPAHE